MNSAYLAKPLELVHLQGIPGGLVEVPGVVVCVVPGPVVPDLGGDVQRPVTVEHEGGDPVPHLAALGVRGPGREAEHLAPLTPSIDMGVYSAFYVLKYIFCHNIDPYFGVKELILRSRDMLKEGPQFGSLSRKVSFTIFLGTTWLLQAL